MQPTAPTTTCSRRRTRRCWWDSLNDSQVMYWEPAKYVAKLRDAQDRRAIRCCFKTNMDAGHGGAVGRYDQLKEIAFEYAWMMRETEVL